MEGIFVPTSMLFNSLFWKGIRFGHSGDASEDWLKRAVNALTSQVYICFLPKKAWLLWPQPRNG